jgi:hypothetical protein
MDATTEYISAFVSHKQTGDVFHLEANPQNQFQILNKTKKFLQLGGGGAATRNNVVRHHVVGEIK